MANPAARNPDEPIEPFVSLEGKRMLVVGASSGIGKAIAIQAVRAGARVAFSARRVDLLHAAVEESLGESLEESSGATSTGAARPASGEARALRCDVTEEVSSQAAVDDATVWLGGLDILVYASGTAPLGDIADLDTGDWARLLATNVVGAAVVIARALPALRATNGTVALLSSHTVGNPWPSLAAYSASKAALEEFGRGLQAEEPRLRVVNIRVGNTATSFADGWDPVQFDRAFAGWLEAGMMRHRVMTSDEVAEQVLAAISDIRGPSELVVRGEDETLA